MTMKPERIKELRELCEGQPPPEWEWEYGVSLRTAWGLLDGTGKPILRFAGCNDIKLCPDADVVMDFITAARAALPEALDEIERARRVLREVLPLLKAAWLDDESEWRPRLAKWWKDGLEEMRSWKAGQWEQPESP